MIYDFTLARCFVGLAGLALIACLWPREDPAGAVLAALGDREVSGRDLRAALNKGRWFWRRWSAPGFYLAMARLEERGLVEWTGSPERSYRRAR